MSDRVRKSGMKHITVCAATAAFVLASCDSMTRPIDTGSFDPLRPPGSGNNLVTPASGFRAGQFVSSIMDNTAFFGKRPKGDADADKLLPRGTSMKVISTDESYVKVELDSGEVGWVPTVMVEDPNAAMGAPGAFEAGNPGEVQVYPPLEGFPALPTETPPEGAIPTVIDPETQTPDAPPPLPEIPGSTPLPDVAPGQ